MPIDDIIDDIISAEGGYVNHPNDLGGPTNFGITQATARANGYHGDMQNMSLTFARQIYKNEYYLKPRFNVIAQTSSSVARELTDTGVNMGRQVAVTFLQRCLNVLNRAEKDYQDLTVDGLVGPATTDALCGYLSARGAFGDKVLVRAMNCLQGARYITLAEKRERNEAFTFGWLKNRVGAFRP